ncbi:membrane protein [Achromobacter sp. RTa]|uniref:PepSY-associated TM helix domain-containing protein n=1 Tax=Achromobacter sp. RTa TaxID=1532557 RepID=UPI00050DBA00|nr:PepSY-associated TM helix domain-containing protein [Achromobacter sp. RTa]KGD86857.1 membrane protein [Achromobacter sp. RTa]
MPRRLWLFFHRWVALGLGGILILSGLSGALLVAARPIDQWLHPAYFVARHAPAPDAAPLEALRNRLAAEFGPDAAFTFRPPREMGETLQVLVRGAWRGTLFLDPATGGEQGRRRDGEGLVATVFSLHSSLMLDKTGRAALAWAALAYAVLLVSGLAVWWPRRWPPSLRMAFDKGTLRALFDVHRNGGAILALVLAVSIATGAYLAWRPIGGWISAALGQERAVAPALPPGAGPIRPLDELAAAALAVEPGATIGYFLYTPRADRPMAVRLRVPDDPHPNGRSTVWLDPRSAAVLAWHRWNELDPGAKVNSILYPLHTGELGGVLGQAAVALLGVALGALGISGIWLWWKRRATRKPRFP